MASPQAMDFYDFEPKDAAGNPFPLHKLKGQVVLIANTASKCGFTPQYKGLETLYKDLSTHYPGRFTILAFPCNQFGNQEPAENSEIQTFCERNYGVSFPVLGKVDVNGDHAEPVFTWLKGKLPGLLGMKRIKWNFEKFLVDGEGRAVQRWSSISKPEGLREVIVKEIEKTTAATTAGDGGDAPREEGAGGEEGREEEAEAEAGKTGANL